MYLILVRHAEKEGFTGHDPGLSTRGLAQAKSLVDVLIAGKKGKGLGKDADEWPKPDRILSSPKRRAQQTLAPLGEKMKKKVDVVDDLDERRSNETNAGFRQRLRRFISELEGGTSKCVVCCSHLDWIEEFRTLVDCETDLLDSPYEMWVPSQFLVLRLDDLWHVVKFGHAP